MHNIQNLIRRIEAAQEEKEAHIEQLQKERDLLFDASIELMRLNQTLEEIQRKSSVK
jgi:hypothetical protein